ncbi:MAG TPA: GGDEF domain-containing protein [Kofleriaceae bacterium]|nr:GGDEF domain-containing protein [Kofleriaceae bacterium]
MVDDWDEEATSSTDVEEIRDKLSTAGSARTRPVLTILTGSAAGYLHKVSKGAAVIGRATNAEVRVDDDGISRTHARLRAETDRAWVEDMGSRNGTFVNGVKISAATELREGDKIQVGRGTVIRFGFQDDLDESFHENLLSSALRDSLTKLFNKRYFLDRLDAELKFAQRHRTAVSLLLLDLDHFKKVNDTLGHLAGDAVLAAVAAALSKAVRNEDVVARYGGEELAIILRAISFDAAFTTADRLRKLVESTAIPFDGQDLRVTVSIGVSEYPSSPAKQIDELIEAADKALYRAKNAGRNRVSR